MWSEIYLNYANRELGTEIVFLVWGCIWASISKCWRVTTVMGTWEHVEDLPSRVDFIERDSKPNIILFSTTRL